MWRFLLGVSTGMYIGTYYECKPILSSIKKIIEDYTPKEKEKKN